MVIPQYESDRTRLKLYDRVSKTATTITEAWQRSPYSLVWSDDSAKVYAAVQDVARIRIYTVAIPSGTPTVVISDHDSGEFDIVPCQDSPTHDCFLFAQAQFVRPTDIFVSFYNNTYRQLTWFNQDRLSQIEFSAAQEFHFAGSNGDDIMGWMFKPYGYVAGNKYPLIMYIHGGPEDSWIDEFHYRWNPQVITGAGYALFAVNPHGSSSYGDAFCQSILHDWGGKPYQDIMMGLDAVGAAFPWADITDAGAMGASFGGYMINWINSQTTRFKALVCHDGMFDPESQYYLTDELYFPEMEFGVPYQDTTYYKKWSPMNFVSTMVTPQLTIHGGLDFRLPDVEGISVFTALQRRGIDSALIRFPEENHWVQDPNNSLYWHQQVLAWFAKYL
eukprot:TRINITY_DN331_c0_g2_i2.p2 TRINITY_DN331_c0_g2~~TRINITY_DN331_c0_g2_i2.p2  ORF type:complete len:389 (+),score=139.92 TRINITY_DN331_c0_g2_i2:198-1364(+)